MQRQCKLPSKRRSSYMVPTEFSPLDYHDMPAPERLLAEPDTSSHVEPRRNSTCASANAERRRSVNTLHFDALQSAVSRLSRMDDFDMEELGYGFFSDVFKVTHKQSGKIMVLKRNKSTNTKLNILREVQLMNRLAHPNILKFMGVCVHEGQLHALTEFINGGDLDQLVQQKNTYLSWAVRIRLALDVSRGLAYLHSLGIFHRDLTAKNCLVKVTTNLEQKKRYSAVVADLGLAEKIPTKIEERERLRVVGTPYCMAPEVLRAKPYDEKSDFFSFGLVICQLIIRSPSDPEKLPRSNDFGLKRELFHALVKKGIGAPEVVTGALPLSMPPTAFQQLAYDCCEVDPSKRPAVKEIVCRLEQVSKEEKTERNEKKELLLRNASGGISKRHSLALAELSSDKHRAIYESHANSQSDQHSLAARSSVQSELTGKASSFTPARRRSSGSSVSSRLSRSCSDVSKELISHAASIIASQNPFLAEDNQTDVGMSSVLHSLNAAFINPFDALTKSELQELKLHDLPSSEVLEMTFDLPVPKLSSVPFRHSARSGVRNSRVRPKSLALDFDPNEVHPPRSGCSSPSPRLQTLELSDVTPHLSNLCGNVSPDSSDATTAAAQESRRLELKQALLRSVLFSPQGRRLLWWWHNHSRSSDWRSLASVLSVMTGKMGVLKKSISVPDLSPEAESLFALSRNTAMSGDSSSSRSSVSSEKESPRSSTCGKPPSGARIHSHAYPAYATLPRKQKSRCSSLDMHRKPRHSKTSDAVFQDASMLGVLHEEAATEPRQAARASSLSRSGVSKSPSPSASVGGTRDDDITPTSVVANHVAGIKNKPRACKENTASNTSLIDLIYSEMSSDLTPAAGGALSSSGSDSSAASRSDLQISLQSGVVSSNRRGKPCGEHRSLALKGFASCPDHPKRADDSNPRIEQPCLSGRSNRDSGYDDVFSVTDPDHHPACEDESAQSDASGLVARDMTSSDPEVSRGLTGIMGRITTT